MNTKLLQLFIAFSLFSTSYLVNANPYEITQEWINYDRVDVQSSSSTSASPDRDLALAAQKGDKKAFAALLQKHEDKSLDVIMGYVKNPDSITLQQTVTKTTVKQISALLVKPRTKGDHPVMLFIHGRWGLTDAVKKQIGRLAERGYVVLAPDYYFARAIPPLPRAHDPDSEMDVQAAIGYIKANMANLTNASTKIGIVAQDHGGYIGTLIASRMGKDIGVLIGLYPLTTNPNLDKPFHLYQFMNELDEMKVPTLIMIGDRDFQMRQIQTGRVEARLKTLGVPVKRVLYKGAGRCFDWRKKGGKLGDKLAYVDWLNQTVKFTHKYMGTKEQLILNERGWKMVRK